MSKLCKSNKKFLINILFSGLIILLGVFLYAPKITNNFDWYNSSEFVLAVDTKDIPHSPGYPLYVELASLFVKLFGHSNVAYGVNMFTAIIGIGGGVLFYLLFRINGFSLITSLLAATLLLTGRNYTEQSIMAEVYNLEICFIILGLIVGTFILKGKSGRWLGFFAGLVGMLGVGHRPSFGLYTLTLFFFVWGSRGAFRPKLNFYLSIAGGVLVGLIPTVILYFKLKTAPGMLFDPLMVQDFRGFLKFVTGFGYTGGLFVFSFHELMARFSYFLWYLVLDSTLWVLMGTLALLYFRLRDERTTFIRALGCILFSNLVLILNYNAFEAHTMLLPSIMCMAAFAAMALEIVEFPRLRTLLGVILVGLLVVHNYVLVEIPNAEAREYVTRSIATIPSASTLILSNDVEFKPYYFLRHFKGLREDLSIVMADNLESSEVGWFTDVILRDRLFSSLVYPKDSRENIIQNHSLECHGYYYKITQFRDSNEEKAQESGQESAQKSAQESVEKGAQEKVAREEGEKDEVEEMVQGPNLVSTMSFELLPMESKILEARAGEAVPYGYGLSVSKEDLNKVAVITLLVDKSKKTQERDGILVGHDIHYPAEFTCKKYNSDLVNLDFGRALVIPYDIEPGDYEIYTMACLAKEGFEEGWLNYLPKNANLLNLDGYEEVFLLNYGLTCRKLVCALSYDEIFKSNNLEFFASEPLLLDEFKVIP